MDALVSALVGVAVATVGVALAVLAELALVRVLTTAWLAARPLSGEHTDTEVYHRSLWTPGSLDSRVTLAALIVAGVLGAATVQGRAELPAWASAAPWVFALAWDLWTWERVAASVKFVSWRRGWRRSARRVPVSDLREVIVAERRSGPLARWSPPAAQLILRLNDGKAVKLPRTGAWFGGEARVEGLANFVRLQIDLVADNRRRAAADKRLAARRAMRPPPPPAHPSTKVDPLAMPFGGG